jgi:predicted RNase H-like nuclease (RuvC/YqgF family)
MDTRLDCDFWRRQEREQEELEREVSRLRDELSRQAGTVATLRAQLRERDAEIKEVREGWFATLLNLQAAYTGEKQ